MNNTGESFDLENDNSLLQINSPRENLSGPYVVVFKNIKERWAIVAIEWDKKPRLGMRWFWGNGGAPFSSGHGIWLVIPPALSKNVLIGLPIDHGFAGKIDDFLRGKINGEQLKGN